MPEQLSVTEKEEGKTEQEKKSEPKACKVIRAGDPCPDCGMTTISDSGCWVCPGCGEAGCG